MTQQQKKLEIAKLLTYIWHEWGKQVTEKDIEFWLSQLHGISRALCWKAAHELVKRKTFGIPKYQDFFQVLCEVAPRQRGTYNGRVETTESILLGGRILPALQKGEQLLLGDK